MCADGGVSCRGTSIPGQLNAHWHWVLILIVVVFPLSLCLCTAGKLLSYMPYDMKLALDQETHSGRPGSPYRLSPRELSKASPQPDPNAPSASRYTVPPGKSTHLHFLFPSFSCLTPFPRWYKLASPDSHWVFCVWANMFQFELLMICVCIWIWNCWIIFIWSWIRAEKYF